MDIEAMFYVFGPLVAFTVGMGIAFFCYSYAEFQRGKMNQ